MAYTDGVYLLSGFEAGKREIYWGLMELNL